MINLFIIGCPNQGWRWELLFPRNAFEPYAYFPIYLEMLERIQPIHPKYNKGIIDSLTLVEWIQDCMHRGLMKRQAAWELIQIYCRIWEHSDCELRQLAEKCNLPLAA